MSDAEIAAIAAWADGGAPRGGPADMPPPVAFIDVDAWEIGEPDLIVSSPSVEVKGDAPGCWGPHGETPSGLPEDRYVAALEFKEVAESRTGAKRDTVGGLFFFHHPESASACYRYRGTPNSCTVSRVHRKAAFLVATTVFLPVC